MYELIWDLMFMEYHSGVATFNNQGHEVTEVSLFSLLQK